MKRSGIGSENMSSLYSGRSYLNPSSKSPLSSYQKALGLSYNSPKNEASKGFVFPQKPYGSSIRTPIKTDKSEIILERRNSKGSTDPYAKSPLASGPSYMAPSSSSRPNKPRGSSTKTYEKSKIDLSSTPKMYNNGLKYSDVLNTRDSSAKQMRTQHLEINTDIQTFKSTGGLKAYSTKNKDVKDRMQSSAIGLANTNSSVEYSKYSNYGNQTVSGSTKFEYVRTEPADDKLNLTPSAKQKNVLSRILANTNDKAYSPGTKKSPQYSSNGSPSASENTLKINNFFASAKRKELESSLTRKEKSLNVSTKAEREREELVRTAELRRKVSPKTTQLSNQKTLTTNTEGGDQEQESRVANTGQKVSLNSFITKVDKGSALPTRAKKDTETEESSPGQPYISLDQKLSSKAGGSKTTTNAENKTITFGKAKLNQQALASSSQESKNKLRQSGGSFSSSKESNREDQYESSLTPTRENSVVYYMTSLEKHHRNWNESDYFCQIFKEHFIQSFQALTFCRYLRPVDPKILAQKKVLLSRKPCYKDKKTVVFDLDETLIHCNESTDIPSDVVLPIKFPHGEIIEAGINIRPYAVEILKEMSQLCEVIIFTASHSCYANVVLDYLDPQNQYISHRLFRESCVVTDEGIYIKDLRVLGNRNFQDTVLVDNAAYSFGYQVENGIPIAPYYDNKEDVELKHLTNYLKSLLSVRDVREVNKQTFKLQSYTQYDSIDKVLNKVILNN